MLEPSADPTSESLRVTINYLSNDSPTPILYLTEPPPGAERDSSKVYRHEVLMHDARDLVDPTDEGNATGNTAAESRLSLDLQGFELAHHQTRAAPAAENHAHRAPPWSRPCLSP